MTHGAVPHSDPYIMSAQERSKYENLFPMYDSDRDGYVTGAEAVNLFSKSGLPREVSFSRQPSRLQSIPSWLEPVASTVKHGPRLLWTRPTL